MTPASAQTTITKGRFVGRGQPLLPDEPRTLGELFLRSADRFRIDNALNFKADGVWKSISSEAMISRIRNIALGLHSIGLRKGDRAAILSANSPEWTLSDAGCQLAGIMDVPIYTTLAANSIVYVMNDSGARLIFLEDAEMFERMRQLVPQCASLETLVIMNGDSVSADNCLSLAELERRGETLGRSDPELLERLIAAVEPDDIATLIYTSGTTGEPKGVMLSHTNIVSNAIDAGEKYSFSGQDISLSVLPLSHIFERTGMYLYILNGMAVHFAESIERVPQNLQEVRPTLFIGVPRIFEKVYAKARLNAAQSSGVKERIFDWAIEVAKRIAFLWEHGRTVPLGLNLQHKLADNLVYSKMRQFFGGNLRFCITGGAALSDDIYLIFTGAGITIMQGYGLTETSPVVSSNNPDQKKLGTVGRPIRNVSVRIADDGEIEVIGPGVMLGYYNKDDDTHAAFTPDGWFRTGDIGRVDNDGFLIITDRKKELFKTSGGKYIAPSPIEQLIGSSRFVSQAVLVGSERKFPAALIVPNFEQLESYAKHKGFHLSTPREFCDDPRIIDLIERQIESHTKDISSFEKVKKFALLENELTVEGGELTPTMKVKRRVVDEKYKDVIDRIYADAEKEMPARSQ